MNHNSKLNSLIRSVVALVLILTLLVTASYAWMSIRLSSNVDTSDFITITADAGLNMNYGDGDNNQGQIKIPDDCVLAEATSTDGTSIFFPHSKYGIDGSYDLTNDISLNDYMWHEAMEIDKNRKYISIDLQISSEENTSIWLSDECYIKNKNSADTSANAVRVSFIDKKDMTNGVVFDNSASKEFTEDYSKHSLIRDIKKDGNLNASYTGKNLQPHAFNEYVQGNPDGNVLFDVKAGEVLNVTVAIWLEGTDKDCTTSVLDKDDLEIFIKFTTSYEEMRTIYFKDYTLEKWVAHDNCYVFAIDEEDNLYSLNKSSNYSNDYTWYGEIPESVTSLRFVRYNPESQGNSPQEWNYWEAGTLGDCNIYNAFGHSAGIWSDSFQGTTITLFDGTDSGMLWMGAANHEYAMMPGIMYISFTATDGNGNDNYYNYKLSYQWEHKQWQIVIPSQTSDITVNMYYYDFEDEDYQVDFENDIMLSWTSTRENELYYTLDYDDTTDYWSDELIYVDGADYTDDDTVIAAYFYDNESDFYQWSGMHATSDKGRYKAAVPPELMTSNNVDSNPDTATVYFTNTQGWGTPYVHYWGSTTHNNPSWPGVAMTYSHKNGYGQEIYKAEVPMDATGLVFNNNTNSTQQTVDIKGYTLYDGIGFYPSSQVTSGNDYNKWNFGTYTNYKSAVIITRYDAWAYEWNWDYVFNQTDDDLATYGTNNLFKITGFTEDDHLTGDWYFSDAP